MTDETESREPPLVGEVVEGLDGVPVLAEVRALEPATAPERAPALTLPAVQAAVMTAGGFFAGALAMALVKRVAGRRLGEVARAADALDRLERPERLDRPDRWPAGTSRTYLVNVRLITRPGE